MNRAKDQVNIDREKLNSGSENNWNLSMEIQIKEVLGKKQLDEFIEFPNRLYKNHPCYIPPLRSEERATLSPEENPAFDFCEARYWLAYKNGKVVGRIAGILNKSFIEKWKQKYLRFGWIDFEEDEEIAKALLTQIENWAKEKKLDAVHGPLGFTDFDDEGMLVEGFDQRATLATIYNYPYYPVFMEKAGYRKDVDWIEYKICIPPEVPERLQRIAVAVKQRYQLNVIDIREKQDIKQHVNQVFELFNEAYENLYGIVPLTKKQMVYYAKQYLSFIKPGFICMVTEKSGKLVAVGVSMPSLAEALQKTKGKLFPLGFLHIRKAFKKPKGIEMLIIAIRKDFQGKGVNAILMNELGRTYIKNGIKWAESNPELEDNLKVQSMWEPFNVVQHKRRRCYIKYLSKF
jgi:GNAT superfamily N-acetyltransferase